MRSSLKSLLIAFTYLIFNFPVSGQEIKICDRTYNCKSAIDYESGLLYFISGDSLKIVDLEEFKLLKVKHLVLPEWLSTKEIIPVCLDKTLYLVNNGGGQIVKYDQDKLLRLDHSFTHKMQLQSAVFTAHNKIYRYGGYGFWSFRNFFTYFDTQSKEWEQLQPTGSKNFPPGSAYGNVVKLIDDTWYVFGGAMLNERQPIEYARNNQCWVFHFSNKKWEYLGRLNEELMNPNLISTIDYNNKVVMVIKAKTFVLDLPHNRLKQYNNSDAANSIRSEPKDYIASYFYKGNFLILGASSGDMDVKLLRISEADFLSDYIGEQQIYETNTLFLISCSLLSILVIAALIIIWFRKRSIVIEKISIEAGKLTYKSREYQPNIEHLNLLNLVLHSEELTTNDLLDFLHKEHLHYSHNTRTINNMIDELNFNIGMLLQKDVKVIQKQKSVVDNRIKVFTIQKKFFAKIKAVAPESGI